MFIGFYLETIGVSERSHLAEHLAKRSEIKQPLVQTGLF